MRTEALGTSKPCLLRASEMSELVTEPNRRPSTPALLRNLHGQPVELASLFLRGRENLVLLLLELGATLLKLGDARIGGAPRLAGRDQEVAGVAVLDFDDVAELAQVSHLLQENDLHGSCPQCTSVVGQKGKIGGARLHGSRQLALVVRLGAGDAGGNDLAVLVDEILEQLDILVVDFLDLLRGEAAELAALEQRVGSRGRRGACLSACLVRMPW